VFIRDVVQTDPNNMLRSRMTEQIRQFQQRPYGLLVVAPEPYLHLRDVARSATSAPLSVPHEILSNQALAEYAEPPPDGIDVAVAALVERLKEEGELDIVAAIRDVAPHFSDNEYFQLLMRATPVLLGHGMPLQRFLEQAWSTLSERLHAQSLELHLRRQTTHSVADGVELSFEAHSVPTDESSQP
jgi:hypothetical protein